MQYLTIIVLLGLILTSCGSSREAASAERPPELTKVVEKYPSGTVMRTYSRNHDDKKVMMFGWYEEFYENGQKKAAGGMSWNQKRGGWSYFFDNGKRQKIENYSETGERLIDEYIEWHENGQIKTTGSYGSPNVDYYVQNAKYGEWKTYYSNGQLESSGRYDDHGRKITGWQYFSEDGKPITKNDDE
jgi:antitoxin component YwqK of YwqJK toxin-antitoxin module